MIDIIINRIRPTTSHIKATTIVIYEIMLPIVLTDSPPSLLDTKYNAVLMTRPKLSSNHGNTRFQNIALDLYLLFTSIDFMTIDLGGR